MTDGQEATTITCNVCGELVSRPSFQQWLQRGADHFCGGRRAVQGPPMPIYDVNAPTEQINRSGPQTPPPTGRQEYAPTAPTEEGQTNQQEWGAEQTTPIQSTVIYATASSQRAPSRRRQNGGHQRNAPQSTIEDILKLRSVAYLLMVDLDHLHHRLLRERRDQLEEAARSGEARM